MRRLRRILERKGRANLPDPCPWRRPRRRRAYRRDEATAEAILEAARRRAAREHLRLVDDQ